CYSLILLCYHPLRSLHSFPTRRSSDLVHIFDDVINAVIGRNLNDTVHPEEDRSLTYHEALHLMGFPENFVLLDGKKHINHIAQKDRKSTRLNSSHVKISYAVFCLKKKK